MTDELRAYVDHENKMILLLTAEEAESRGLEELPPPDSED
jgi:hypothetical protein